MKHLFTVLIRKDRDGWWEARTSEGNPPEERVRMFILPALVAMLKHWLSRVKE